MAPAGSDLGERGQSESALRQARVRQDEAGPGSHNAAEIQDVAVDHPRPVAERG